MTIVVISEKSITAMSPSIERPLTLRASPSDHATFNQTKSFLVFYIRLLLEREKTAKGFHFKLSLLSRGGFRQNFAKVVKKDSALNFK